MRVLFATAILLAAAHADPRAAVEPERLEETAVWLRAEAARIRAAPTAGATRSALESLKELRQRLERAGLSGDLAGALASAPGRSAARGGAAQGPAALEAVRRRIEAFARASRRPPPPANEGARAKLETILREPLFAEAREIGVGGQLRAWLLRQLLKTFVWFQTALRSHGTAVTVAASALIAGALIAVAWLLSAFLGFAGRAPLKIPQAAGGGAQGVAAEEILAWGIREAGAGRLLEAVKLYALAAVTALRARGEIPTSPGLTDLEAACCLREGGPTGDLSTFERLAALHDAAIFGGRGAGEREAGEAEGLARTILRAPREAAA